MPLGVLAPKDVLEPGWLNELGNLITQQLV